MEDLQHTADFQQHLADYNVHVNNWRSKALNATEMQSELAHERASLSPSQFSDSDFEESRRKNEDPALESEVITSVLPILCGNSSIHNQQNVLFTELEPITNSGAIQPKPDFFDGACLGDLDQNIRNNEGILSAAIPTKHPNVPVVPNFFLEVQGPDGNASVAQRQACYDGAYGTRAIHALQNYKETDPIYDGNAYTYSSTYYAGTGTLQLYAHHVTAPATVNERPQYHMTQIDGWQMTGNINSFRRGATVFETLETRRNDTEITLYRLRMPKPPKLCQACKARTTRFSNSSLRRRRRNRSNIFLCEQRLAKSGPGISKSQSSDAETFEAFHKPPVLFQAFQEKSLEFDPANCKIYLPIRKYILIYYSILLNRKIYYNILLIKKIL